MLTLRIWVGVVLAAAAAARADRDYAFFLERVIDLDHLPVLEEGVRCAQFSSYNRASRYDEATGKYVNWEANADSGKYLRIDSETGEAVMAEMQGPGCIWRIWSANPQGRIRFYLDGAPKPTFECDFNELFSGRVEGFPRPLVWQRRIVLGGDNPASDSYVPIPYARSCKVTADRPHNQYYHIGYTTYPKGTGIETFSLDRDAREQAAMQRVCKALSNCGEDPQLGRDVQVEEDSVTVYPGETVDLEIPGPAIIRQCMAKVASEERWARRKIRLQVYWDDEERPSVDAPIGDFFGDAWEEARYRSLPLGITDDLNYCYWRMPFEKSARFVVTNSGNRPAGLRYRIAYESGPIPARAARFHAKWRRDRHSTEFDYPVLVCEGRGKFVGMVLFPDNIVGGWWGEGDEKVYVDGEKFPSTFGTGSEDYFGDAWGILFFTNALHGSPTPGGWNTRRRQSCYRWHIADSIPFEKSFRFTIENYSALGRGEIRNDYSSMAYWYQVPGGSDFFAPTTVEDRIPQGPIQPGAIDAEGLVEAGSLPDGASIVSDEELPEALCRGKGLRIRGPAGTTVPIRLPAPDEGRFAVQVVTAEGLKRSEFELVQDGRPVGEHVRLRKGPNPISVRLTGKPVEGDRCEVILDYFLLRPYRKFVTDWQILGPFDNTDDKGVGRAFGPETDGFLPGKTYEGKRGPVTWRKIRVPEGRIASDQKYFEDNQHIILYAYCEIFSPGDRSVQAFLGSDDGVDVRVNGTLVHQAHGHRAYVEDQDRFMIPLRKGRNAILIKLDQAGGAWSLAFRVNDPDEELRYEVPQ